jgi:hypothetical protein
MKRVMIIVACLSILVAGMAFAAGPGGLTAIGVYGNYGFTGGGGGVGLSFKFGSFPVVGVKYDFSGAGRFGATVDWFVIDAMGLLDNITLFLGPGLFIGVGMGGDAPFDVGIRFPIGIQLWIARKLEIFLDAVPAVPLLPQPGFAVGAEFGMRIHF